MLALVYRAKATSNVLPLSSASFGGKRGLRSRNGMALDHQQGNGLLSGSLRIRPMHNRYPPLAPEIQLNQMTFPDRRHYVGP